VPLRNHPPGFGFQRSAVGVLDNEHHKLSVQIRKIAPNGISTTEYPIRSKQDIWIGAVNAATKGVSVYTNDRARFDRKKDQGDREDFRWIVDVEGSELHNTKLTIARPEKLAPTFHFTHGVFYSSKLSDERVGRVDYNSNKHPMSLGKVAEEIAADIYLDDNATGVVLLPEGNASQLLMLKREPGVRYEIAVKNLPDSSMQVTARSHFSYFYEAITDRSGKKFDLKLIEKNKDNYSVMSLGNSFVAGSYFTPASLTPVSPEVPPCIGIRVSKTDSLKGEPRENDRIGRVLIWLRVMRVLPWGF
jgi:hypothetical protein